jgi:hypothetical protein
MRFIYEASAVLEGGRTRKWRSTRKLVPGPLGKDWMEEGTGKIFREKCVPEHGGSEDIF